MNLHDPSLLCQSAFVGGKWIEARGRPSIEVRNPATGALVGLVPKLGSVETAAAIDAAQFAQKEWAARTAKERSTSCANGST